MNESAAVIFTNDAFYRAFADRDLDAIGAIWADREPVTCLHPGWAPLRGREAVLESFAAIFQGPAPPEIGVEAAEAAVHGDLAVVICYERIGHDFLIATNVFRHDGDAAGGWRLVHHQAGPVNEPPRPSEDPPSPVN